MARRRSAMIAVLTAGGTVHSDFAREIGTSIKALAPWRGMKLLDTSLQAARVCGATRIVIIGGAEVQAYCEHRVDRVLPAVQSGEENLSKALRCAEPDQPLLLLTTDMPFLTSDALQTFIAHVGESDIAMPLADGKIYEQTYPHASNHVTNLGGERIANGNVFYFSSGKSAERARAVAQRLFRARKSLVAMASLLDIPLMLRFATRTLTVTHLEAYAEQRFLLRARAVRHMAPELCYDIDSLADYRYALAAS